MDLYIATIKYLQTMERIILSENILNLLNFFFFNIKKKDMEIFELPIYGIRYKKSITLLPITLHESKYMRLYTLPTNFFQNIQDLFPAEEDQNYVYEIMVLEHRSEINFEVTIYKSGYIQILQTDDFAETYVVGTCELNNMHIIESNIEERLKNMNINT